MEGVRMKLREQRTGVTKVKWEEVWRGEDECVVEERVVEGEAVTSRGWRRGGSEVKGRGTADG